MKQSQTEVKEKWMHVSSSVDVSSDDDARSLSAQALVRVDGDEQISMSTTAGYDDGGAHVDMTVNLDQEQYLHTAAHIGSTDAGDGATEVDMAALLRVDNEQVFDMEVNGAWREDSGATVTVTVEDADEDQEWMYVSSSVDVSSDDDAHSLSAQALVRVDGDEQISMSTTAGYDDGGAHVDMTVNLDQEQYLHTEAHIGSTDASDGATQVDMAALLRVDNEQVFDMEVNGAWQEDSGATVTVTVEDADEDQEWMYVSSSVDVSSDDDARSLSAQALVRVDGDEQMSMSTTAGYDDGGAHVDMTVNLDQEQYLHTEAHIGSTDAGDGATEVDMAALLRVDNEQVFGMEVNGAWREDSGATVTVTVEDADEDQEWMYVSSSVDVSSDDDARSLSAQALVRVDGDEQISMSTTAGHDDGGAHVDMTVNLDQEQYLHTEAHIGSTDAGDGVTEVDMAALLRVDNEQVFDMEVNGAWQEDSGATVTVTVEDADEDQEWMYVSSSVDVSSDDDARSLSAQALVRVDGDEQMSMSTTAGYDDGGAHVDMTVNLDQEQYLHTEAHIGSTDAGDGATEVDMAALLRVDNEQVFDMEVNGAWQEDSGATVTVTVEDADEDQEWMYVSSSVDVGSDDDARSLSAQALVRVDGDEQISMSTTAGYDDGGAHVDMTANLDQEQYLHTAAHIGSTDAGNGATEVDMAALLRVDNEQVFDMEVNGAWQEDSGATVTVTVEDADEDQEWMYVSSSVDVTVDDDARSLSAQALVRVDGDEQISMSTTAGYDDGGAHVDMTVNLDQEQYLHTAAHIGSTDAGDGATEVDMAALLRVDNEQVFDMEVNGAWREDSGATVTVTVEDADEDQEWMYVSSSVDVSSDDDARSLSAQALVRVDGDEQISMSTTAGYDDGGAHVDMTVNLDQEQYLHTVAHIGSTDAGDGATEVDMAALLRVDNEQVFDMEVNGAWREDSGATVTVTVEDADEDQEWMHVSSSVDVSSDDDAHSLSAQALVRVDGDEQISMSTTAGYDDGGAHVDMTVNLDQEQYLHTEAHIGSTDASDGATQVDMAALLRVDNEQVFDMEVNGAWQEDSGATVTVTVEDADEDQEWMRTGDSEATLTTPHGSPGQPYVPATVLVPASTSASAPCLMCSQVL
ncbi:hypothetical protein CYMTET_9787 [Cymbomonas tetramitiformis]|uniref:Uncharacterized protein n=1 Tax=Cymbomonas tetramitiformis TaxID=36881 RepID=A0AAE0GQH6_9CHLO|nr:hypothetical protein CYMTET_9787 [Cymbomonas tetramitiformis]